MKKLLNKFLFFILFLLLAGTFVFCVLFVIQKQTNTDVAIIGAMDCEVEYLSAVLKNSKTIKDKNFKIYKGKIGKYNAVVAKSGVGKVQSAITTQYLIDNYNPKLIINTGIAGSVSNELKTGDVVFASFLVQHDFDTSYFGYSKGYISGNSDSTKPTLFGCDLEMNKNIIKITSKRFKNLKPKEGIIATGDKFVADVKDRNFINEYFGAIAADMESAAIVQTANKNNVPCVVIRAISDNADGNNKQEYEKHEKDISKLPSQIVEYFLDNYQQGIVKIK